MSTTPPPGGPPSTRGARLRHPNPEREGCRPHPTRDRLEDLGLDLKKTAIEFSGIGKKQRLYSTEVDDLSIGGASTGPISIFAANLGHLRKMLRETGSREPDGLLGADFLARWSANVEVKHSKLYLRLK